MSDDFDLVDRIYEAGAIQDTWSSVLKSISDRYDGAGGLLFAFGAQGAQNWLASPEIRETLETFLREGWQEINRRPQRLAELNYFGFVNDLDTFTLEEIEHDRVYREFYSKHGLGWAAGTMIPVPSGDTLVFSFERAFRKGPFQDFELLELDELRPHLARAALWSSRLDFKRAQAMAGALEAAGLPAAVLRQGGRLYAANALFEKLMPDVAQDRRERLTLTNPAADGALLDTLQRLGVERATRQSRSIAIPKSEGVAPMVAHIAPIRGAANDLFSQSVAMLIVTPIDRKIVPTAEVLQGLFDLTPAEARVARGIGQAKTVETVALESGVSRETVRTQLASVMTKTGMGRQAELVALLGGKTIAEG
jgi:DNA-binding CsgD family transcriptional regulator